MPATQVDGNSIIVPVGQVAGTCSHCVGQGSSTVTVASPREPGSQKRDANAPVKQLSTKTVSHAALFSQKFVPTQNAPPFAANRQYLLLGVFLI